MTDLVVENSVFRKGDKPKVLIIEAFYGGSHRELIDNLRKSLGSYTLVTLSSKKWHWRSRCGALCLLPLIPNITTEEVLFCSSVLSLAELVGIRPDLCNLRKVIYFHENQFIYPIQDIKKRDIQYPYNQLTSCLAADVILFNSHFNRDTFLNNIKKIIKLIPDYRPKNLEILFREKSDVLYFPIEFPDQSLNRKLSSNILTIAWPHRWEFDKGPDDFFNVCLRLQSEGISFKLVILGECYNKIPDIIVIAKEKLKHEIVHCGFLELKKDYYDILRGCDLVVSTSKHEFFGVAMLEASFCGCFPLVPNNLVYPEVYPECCLYRDLEDLYSRLKLYCQCPNLARDDRANLDFDVYRYSTQRLIPQFLKVLGI